MTSCRSSSSERSTARAVPKLAENDDEQEFIPGPALTGSGEFCLLTLKTIIILVGENTPDIRFLVEAFISKHCHRRRR